MHSSNVQATGYPHSLLRLDPASGMQYRHPRSDARVPMAQIRLRSVTATAPAIARARFVRN
jgi:hypothetical protein